MTIYYPHKNHSLISERSNISEQGIKFISIDPAIKNLAIRIETRTIITEEVKDGDFIKLVKDIKVNALLFERINLGDGDYIDSLYTYLNSKLELFKDVNFVIIEEQLGRNPNASKIGGHLRTFFCSTLKDCDTLPMIIEVSPKLKTLALNAPAKIKGKQVKKWSVEYGRKLIKKYKDLYSLSVLDINKSKQDDLTDTVCQIEAVCKTLNLNDFLL